MNNRLLLLLILSTVTAFAATAATDTYGDSIVNLREVSVAAVKKHGQTGDGASTVVARHEIERKNIVNAKDISIIAPNFFIPDYGSRITSSIYVRGLGARIDQPAVGMVVDNVPILNKDNYDFDLTDIDRIRIDRGPQSAMYGRNTMGGVIDIRTISPLSYQGTRLLAEYGKSNSAKAAVSHYARPTRKFGAGGSVSFAHTDGFFRNMANGEKCGKENYARAMLKLAWKPNSQVILENMASATVSRQGGYAYEFADTKEINYNDTCFYRRNSVLDGLTIGWHNDRFSLTSVTSYQYIDDNMTLDQDFLPESYFTLTQKKREHAVTQDLIVKGKAAKGKLAWLGGAFGFYRNMQTDAPVCFKPTGIKELIISKWNEMNPSYPIGWNSDSFLLGSEFKMPSYGISVYGEARWENGPVTLTAALRLDHESAKLDFQSDCSTGYTVYHHEEGKDPSVYSDRKVEIHRSGSLRRSFTQLLPKISAVYRLPSAFPASFYLSASKGYKAGGFNTQMFSDVLQQELMAQMGIGKRYDVDKIVGYKPEKTWNYELGGHFASSDERIKADFSVFYIDCRDQQLTVFPDGDVTGRIMTNAGRTRSCGIELAATYTPIDRLTFSAGYGYTNAKFREFNNGKVNYSGKFIPYAPQNTIFASANYAIKLDRKVLRYISVGMTMSGVGKVYWDEANEYAQNFYAKLDASVKLSFNKFSIDVWSKNITSTNYDTFYFVSIQHRFTQKGKPAQFGTTLRLTI